MECNVFSGLGIRLPLVLLTARSLALSPSAILIAIVQTQAGMPQMLDLRFILQPFMT
jgi:hypothetical protein